MPAPAAEFLCRTAKRRQSGKMIEMAVAPEQLCVIIQARSSGHQRIQIRPKEGLSVALRARAHHRDAGSPAGLRRGGMVAFYAGGFAQIHSLFDPEMRLGIPGA